MFVVSCYLCHTTGFVSYLALKKTKRSERIDKSGRHTPQVLINFLQRFSNFFLIDDNIIIRAGNYP